MRKEQEEEKEVRRSAVHTLSLSVRKRPQLRVHHLQHDEAEKESVFCFSVAPQCPSETDCGSAGVSEVTWDLWRGGGAGTQSNILITARPVPTHVTLHTHSCCSVELLYSAIAHSLILKAGRTKA